MIYEIEPCGRINMSGTIHKLIQYNIYVCKTSMETKRRK